MALLRVKTKSGIIEGLPANNQSISVFKGIPFAKPPVGELRWKNAQKIDPWDDVLLAYKFSNIPYQPRFSSEGGSTLASTEFYVIDHPMSEDCLYLNIWSPAQSSNEKLPVAIYIHGGGFETGYSFLNAYDGEIFAKNGVVLVTIAYRLNIFGFLATEDLLNESDFNSTGNYGLSDQLMAVEWVRENVTAFGGDPNNITIFGQSAGGSSVKYLCQSELTKGYFKNAIMQSGGGLTKDASLDALDLGDALELGKNFLQFANANTISEARELDPKTLLDKYIDFKAKINIPLPFTPIIDEVIIKEKATSYFTNGKHDNINYLIGCTSDEMRVKKHQIPSHEVMINFANKRVGLNKSKELLELFKVNDNETKDYFEDIVGKDFYIGSLAWCINQVNIGFKPAYAYYFSYVPPGAGNAGAHHSVEHHYVFQTLNRSNRPYDGKDFDLSNELVSYWVNFIKTGNPNGIGSKVNWEPYTYENPKFLEIGDTRKMILPPKSKIIDFLVDYSLGRT